MPSFEVITGYLKTFSKSIKEDETMGLKNKTLIVGWILITSKVYRRQNFLVDLKIGCRKNVE